MKELSIPIYRAKNINGVESHKGLLKWNKNKTKFWINDFENGSQEIDPSTLAIHFPDLIDSEGTKIFASLSKDGKGGDNIKESPFTTKWVVKYGKYYENPFDSKRGDHLNRYGVFVEADGEQKNINHLFTILNEDHQKIETNERIKVTGIQE